MRSLWFGQRTLIDATWAFSSTVSRGIEATGIAGGAGAMARRALTTFVSNGTTKHGYVRARALARLFQTIFRWKS